MVAHQISAAKGQKQSALKKLRTALSSAGLTGPKAQVSKKDKKRGVRKATNIKTAERRHKLRQIQTALNPFEMKVNRKKLDVLGLKRKDDEVNVAVARQRALEKRKTTIGEERRSRHRLGGVVDRRIGENDPAMDPEEKMLKRFTAERQKRGASMFNIEDSDVEGEITALTHYGQAIDDLDDLDLNGSDDDDEDKGVISARDVDAAHFGGFEEASGETDGSGRKKTKAEVMQELIAKSKRHKQERQLAKEQDDDLRRELDGDFEDVRALLFADNDDKPMMKAADAGAIGDTAASSDRAYDAVVRELVFEQRARPQDRLKTEEEQARDEMERLERAERHRRRRMDGLDSATEAESDAESDAEMRAYKTESRRRPVADDLGDDFAPAGADDEDEGGAARVSLGTGLQAAESEDEDEDEEDESGDEEDSGDEDDDDEEESENEEGGNEEDQALFKTRVSRASASASASSADELPYTFAAPADYDAWVELVGSYSLDQQMIVIRRLRTLYHIRLSPQNKQKLSDLCLILTEHLAVLAEQDPPVPGSIIDELVKHIGELASVDSERFGEHCRQTVVDCHRRIQQAIRASGATDTTDTANPASSATLGLRASDVALMRMFASVFSASDRYHPVVTPMLTAICQYLGQHTFATLRDIATGLLLVGLVHETQRLSRRVVPEALNFLLATLAASVCSTDEASDWDGQYALPRRQRLAYRFLRIGVAEKCRHMTEVQPVTWAWLTSDVWRGGGSRAIPVDAKYSVLRACLTLSQRFIDSYFAQPAFIEMFTPLQLLLRKVSNRLPKFKLQHAPGGVLELVAELQAHLDAQLELSAARRTPLKMQSHRPIALEAVAPKFESSYSLDVHYDPDRARNEVTKLRRQVNREKRGAVRELRRDTQFIAAERLKEQREKDRSYADKMKKAWSVLESDQSQLKKMDRMRIREKKAKV
ncbi:nucleolar complex protein 14 [Coemansia erecta]|uniref:Nucleolar complex protein 14 n=1 Tax=Coemansia erecta TaxID=147472 RepID=A0A9W7Y5Q4_9FUNG|nr:nucleolar complex protein 14 [Coemansia erecta]